MSVGRYLIDWRSWQINGRGRKGIKKEMVLVGGKAGADVNFRASRYIPGSGQATVVT